MEELEKKINLSVSDLQKVQRRIKSIEEMSDRSMNILARAADDCWQYPNADKAYADLSDKMINIEERYSKLSEASELIDKVVDILSKCK